MGSCTSQLNGSRPTAHRLTDAHAAVRAPLRLEVDRPHPLYPCRYPLDPWSKKLGVRLALPRLFPKFLLTLMFY